MRVRPFHALFQICAVYFFVLVTIASHIGSRVGTRIFSPLVTLLRWFRLRVVGRFSKKNLGRSGKISPSLGIRSVFDIVTDFGYACESHLVYTQDGYGLTVFRITSNVQHGEAKPRPPVILWHGLLDCCYTWITNGPGKSLAFVLADAGYTVYLANNRGTAYGLKHMYFDVNDELFWKFSLDEMAKYDVPAVVSLVDSLSNGQKISYVGHSEGTTIMFAALSSQPLLAEHLAAFVALGPVVSVGNVTNPLLKISSAIRLCEWLMFLGFRKGFLRPPRDSLIREMMGWFVTVFPGLTDDILDLLCGPSTASFTPNAMGQWGEHEPGGTSMYNMLHWEQSVRNGQKFQMLDYGKAENQARYHQEVPPVYELTNICKKLPKALFYGTNDQLVDPTDLQNLIQQLQGGEGGGSVSDEERKVDVVSSLNVIPVPGYNHTDFLWDDKAATVLYPSIVEFLSHSAPPSL